MAVDDRKRSKSRFTLFLVLSLLMHTSVVIYLFWHPISFVPTQIPEQEKKTVVVKLKQEKKEEKKEEKKDDKKSEQQKQQQANKSKKESDAAAGMSSQSNKSDSTSPSQDSSAQSKSAAQKAEAKEAQAAKKAESAQGKAAQEPPSKAQPAKAEASKGQPQKGEVKQEVVAKGEPAKGEPTKGQPAQGEPKKGEPTKQQAKSAQDKPVPTPQQAKDKPKRIDRPEFGMDYSEYQKPRQGVDMPEGENKQPGLPDQDPNNLAYWSKRMGNVKQLNETALQRSIVITEGANQLLDQRQQQGLQALQTLTKEQKQEFSRVLNDNVGVILANYVKPKKDGNKYYGEIRFTVDEQGFIVEANFKIRSGNDELDQAMLNALTSTRKLQLSADPYVSRVVAMFPVLLNYSEEDME